MASASPLSSPADADAGGAPPVRVMHVVFSLEPGGMELGVVKLVNGLDPRRVHSVICATRPGGRLIGQVRPPARVFELRRRPGTDPHLVLDLYRLCRAERPHIVHTHAWGTLLEGLTAARLARVPAVVHGEHGTVQGRRHQRWAQRLAWGAADQVLSVSSRLAERMSAVTGFDARRIRTIRNGVDLARFAGIDRAAARAVLGLDAGRLVVGAVGRLVAVKDHGLLIEAAARLRARIPTLQVAIAGEGPERSALLARAAALDLSSHVRLLGHRRDVEHVLAAVDVFVQPSRSEGLSNTILEAMAAGRPVVATAVGGADEIVREGVTGLLVPPRDPTALSAAIGSLLADRATAAAMGAAGRARAEEEFTLGGMIRAYESLYLNVAGRTSRPVPPLVQPRRASAAEGA